MSGPPPRWGWHQLDSRRAARFVEDARVKRGELVLDIGAGTGAITHQLVAHGARVVAIELHPRRCDLLRERFRDAPVTVVRADGADLRLPLRPFRVVANPPFAVSVAILRRLTAPGSRLVRADLIVPWHTAERWVSGSPPGAGRWRALFSCSLGPSIARSAFQPPATQGVAILVIRRQFVGGRRS